MNVPQEFVLNHPVTMGDETISKITIKRRVLTKDLRAMEGEKNDVGKVVLLIEKLTDESSALIDHMDASDFKRLSEVVSSFLS
ncbi:MAG: phage tail assembly protein [Proteobacteria bacterium]|nr:phage tail assembly protein [Pseudomonadota bacterium]MBU4472143.1 phage tail assembly protein [Pseudomonadota bacterium]MCG2752859.1 phage tail assembly protein [Desulfobacteraceae bacterium]